LSFPRSGSSAIKCCCVVKGIDESSTIAEVIEWVDTKVTFSKAIKILMEEKSCIRGENVKGKVC